MNNFIKVIMGGSFDGMDQFAEIIKVGSRGLDTGWLTKRASVSDRIRDIQPEKDRTLIHLLALGDGEYYGCFPAGTPILNGELQQTSIEDVQLGDLVVTHRNRLQPVISLYQREFTGAMYSIRTLGNYEPITCTDNHKFFVIPAEQTSCHIYPSKHKCVPGAIQNTNFCSSRNCKTKSTSYFIEECRADELEIGDYLLIPAETGKIASWDITEEQAYVAGLFAAGGSYSKHTKKSGERADTGIQLAIHMNEVNIFREKLEKCLPGVQIKAYNCGTDNSAALYISNSELAAFLRANVGEYSYAKKLSKRILTSSVDCKKAFLAGYFDGDGHLAAADGRWTARTVSKQLAYDVQYLVRSIGLNATVCIATKAQDNDRESYNISFSSANSGIDLSKWSYKHFDREAKQNKGWSFFWNGYYCVPIKEITREQVTTKVYNIEVAEDHSYVVGTARLMTRNCNRNGDNFSKAANEKYHKTFETNAKFYRHHVNKDPAKSYGEVKIAEYNPKMHRVELVVSLDNTKCAEELDLLEKKGEFPVSMACLRAGSKILTSTGFVNVEDIKLGDLVLTHLGRYMPVTQLQRRTVGDYYEVELSFWGRSTLEITGNHEVYVATFNDIELGNGESYNLEFKLAHRAELHTQLKWLTVDELTKNYYFAVPIDRVEDVDMPLPTARLLGYYVGYAISNDSDLGIIQFETVKNASILSEISDLASWDSLSYYRNPNSSLSVISCYSTAVAEYLEETAGDIDNIRIPVEIMHSQDEAKLNFISTWFNCVGWQDHVGMQWGTRLRGLALDLQRLLASVNIPSVCCRVDIGNQTSYVISVSNQYSGSISNTSQAQQLTPKSEALATFISGDYLMVPVKAVNLVDEPTDVYNFAVDTDESYTVEALAVHNCRVPYDVCSICDHKAMYRDAKFSGDPNSYCDHALNHLTKIAADGRQVYVDNTEPTFFDISRVRRPADRIAWTFQKVASDGIISGAELAAELGYDSLLYMGDKHSPEVRIKVATLNSLVALEKSLNNWLNTTIKQASVSRDKIPDGVLNKLAAYSTSTDKFKDVIGALTSNLILLTPYEFFKVATGEKFNTISSCIEKIANCLPSIFSSISDTEEFCIDGLYDGNTNLIPKQLRDEIEKVAGYSAFSINNVQTRLIKSAMMNPVISVATRKVENNNVLGLAKEYAKYQLGFVTKLANVSDKKMIEYLTVASNYVR